MKQIIIPEQKLTKAVLRELVDDVIENVNEGEIEPLEAYAHAKKYEKIAKALINGLKEYAIEDSKNYKEQSMFGVKISPMTSAKWNFKGDATWVELQDKIDDLKAKQKKLELLLKAQYLNNDPFCSVYKSITETIKIELEN